MDTALPTLLTPQDVGLWLSLPSGRVLRMARQGEIPCIVLPSNDIIFDRDELRRWLDSLRAQKQGGPDHAA